MNEMKSLNLSTTTFGIANQKKRLQVPKNELIKRKNEHEHEQENR